MSVDSPTHAASDVHRAYADKVRELEDSFPAQQGQCGVFLGLGRDMCVDVVSQPDAFARLWPKLRAGDDLRLRGERVIGSGLELEGELIQLSAFTSRDGGCRSLGRIARPSMRH